MNNLTKAVEMVYTTPEDQSSPRLSPTGTIGHRWAQLTKKLASLSAIPIVKNLASLTLIRYFALIC